MRSLSFIVAAMAFAWPVASLACDRVSLDPTKLGEVSAFLTSAVERQRIPGALALIVDCKGVVYHEAFGEQDLARGIAMRKDSLFRIASMTKVITSIGILKLVEQGRLRLDDEARTWVAHLRAPLVLTDVNPNLKTFAVRPADRPITVRQLLTHTSGIGYPWSDPALAMAQASFGSLRPNGSQVLAHEPGARWTYGSGPEALGEIISGVSKKALDVYFRDTIFRPLRMRDTGYFVPRAKHDRVVTVRRRSGGAWQEEANPEDLGGYVSGDSGLYATAWDYGRLLRLLLNNGKLDGERVLTQESVRALGSPQLGHLRLHLQPSLDLRMARPFPVGADSSDTWGLGLQLAGPPAGPDERSRGSMSWAGLFNTFFWVDPERNLGAVLLMQILPFYDPDALATLEGFEKRVYRSLR